MNLDIIIQGPYHNHVLVAIERYKPYGNIILSCYDTDDVPYLPSYVKLIQSPVPSTVGVYNRCNAFYQCYTTLKGIEYSTASCIIKTRTQEIYGNIKPFVEKVLSSNKLVTGNVAFPRTSVQPFHPSDHLMGGSRELIRHMFHTAYAICLNAKAMEPFTWQDCLNLVGEPLAEQLLCLSYFQSLGLDIPKKPTVDEQRKLLQQYFEVVPVEDMAPVIHTINVSGERRFRLDGEGLYGYPHESIRHIGEV